MNDERNILINIHFLFCKAQSTAELFLVSDWAETT